MKQRSFGLALAGVAVAAGLAAGIGLTKRPAQAQGGLSSNPPIFSQTDMHGAFNMGMNKDGEAVIAYGNGVVAIVHPGSGAAPNGYIHTNRVTPTGAVLGLGGTSFDSDTGKTYEAK